MNLSMRQVALSLQIPYTTYVSYEKNEREPNSEALIMLADFFDCSIDFLIGRSKQVKMLTLDEQQFNLSLSPHEQQLVSTYRKKPEMQPAIDKILGIDNETIEVLTAARSSNNEPIGSKTITKEQLENLRNAPSVENEDDL